MTTIQTPVHWSDYPDRMVQRVVEGLELEVTTLRSALCSAEADSQAQRMKAVEVVMMMQEREAELVSLLRRIDAVVVWESTPLERGFQEEIERALRGKGTPHEYR